MAYQDFDFMGFTYNGKHSYRDLKIYRVSNSDRYEETFTPTFQEKTASVDGMVGMYYFGQNVQQKQFNISFAFDKLTEDGVRKLKQTFNGDGIYDLIFDECPYKVYSAKVTGSATIKHICFELEEGRVYRGEGSIQFTCYYPYAHTPHSLLGNGTVTAETIDITYSYNDTSKNWARSNGEVYRLPCGIAVDGSCNIAIPRLGSPDNAKDLLFQLKICYYANRSKNIAVWGQNSNVAIPAGSTLTTSFNKAYIDYIEYSFKQNPDLTGSTNGATKQLTFTPTLTAGGITYTYSKTGTESDYCYRPTTISNAKIVNHYASYYYPTKREWYEASGLPLHTAPTTNVGDLPTPFIVTYNPASAAATETNTTLTVNGKAISFKRKEDTDYTWNSRTGTLCKKVSSVNKPIAATGDICYEIPVNGSLGATATGGAATDTVNFNCDIWYY